MIYSSFFRGAFKVLAVAAFLAATYNATANDWPHWRGPNHNGTAEATNMPGAWTEENILWKTPLPGQSSASPLVVGDKVFCVSNNAELTSLQGLCLNRDSGEILWQKEFAQTDVKPKRDNTMASPSPVSDGEKVYFLFGTGDLIATNLEGEIKWSRNLVKDYGPINQQFGYSSSPLIFKGKLYVSIIRGQWDRLELEQFTDEDSHLLCIDPATGKDVWRIHRPSDGADEAFDAYTSPMPYEHGDVSAILTQGANYLTAHDAATGAELWRQNHNPEMGKMWRLIPSPVAAGELVIGVQPRGQAAFAILPGDNKNFAFTESHWIFDTNTTDVPTPVFYKDHIYLIHDVRGLLFCLEAKTGKEIWKGELDADSRIWASAVVADDKMYIMTENGQVITVGIGGSFEVLSRNSLGGTICKSSPAIADNKLFVRTSDAIYSIGTK